MFSLTDEDAFGVGEKLLMIVGCILLAIAAFSTDNEFTFWIFGENDPYLVALFFCIAMFSIYGAYRCRFRRTSYTFESTNYHCALKDPQGGEIAFKPYFKKSGASKSDKAQDADSNIYPTYRYFIKGTSFPRMSLKRVIIIIPENCFDRMRWGIRAKCTMKRFVFQDHKNLPPHITKELQRIDPSIFKYRYCGSVIWFADHPDEWVARHVPRGFDAPDGNEYFYKINTEAPETYSQAEEESLNRTIHDQQEEMMDLEAERFRLNGMPDLNEEETDVA